MKQGSNSRRSRGRGNGKRPQKNYNFDSAGPEGRVRGNAQQVYEKYIGLARDAMSAGDRIATENYFQHAEHYLRVLMAQDNGDGRIEAFRQRQQRVFGPDEFDESGDDGEETTAGGNEAPGDTRPQENRQQENRARDQRDQDGNRQREQRDHDGNRPRRDNRDQNDRRNNNQQRSNEGRDGGNNRRVPIERGNEQAAQADQAEDADRDVADDDGLRRTLAI